MQIKCKIDTKDKYITIYYSFLKINTIITVVPVVVKERIFVVGEELLLMQRALEGEGEQYLEERKSTPRKA